MVSINKKNYKPPLKDVKERYYEKFRKSTKDNTSGAGPPAAPAPAVTLRRSTCSTDTGWAEQCSHCAALTWVVVSWLGSRLMIS